jgi:glutamate synthase domain-containing protein 2
VDQYFTGTSSRIEGVNLEVLAKEAIAKHRFAFAPITDYDTELAVGGNYHFRVRGEYHLFNPLTISKLQHAVREDNPKTFQEYTDLIDKQNQQLCTLRVFENTIALETMLYADEVRPTADLDVPEEVAIGEKELKMAKSLVEMLTGDFEPGKYQDNYREALLELIERKAEGQDIKRPKPVASKVTDLMEALRASVEAARKDLESVAGADVIGSVESEIALDILEPAKGAIPGTPKGVPGL